MSELSSESTSWVSADVEGSVLVVPKQSDWHPSWICVVVLVTWDVDFVSRALACCQRCPWTGLSWSSATATCTWVTP